ncbi:sphingoid long-chain base transporter [Aspergillus pseudodeflectus]|uniref:Sphingoid long-chain base transporter n=1 Tax=Aspergillus pseudodeflectus TaxID=176178 RepID=A0ABR4J9H3_9EURO
MASRVTAPAPWITNSQQCTLDTCPISLAHTTYLPNLAGNAFYMALFALLILIQLVIGIRTRTWSFMGSTICGLILEVLGYAARIKMRSNPFIDRWFTMYIVCLTIAPAFLSAAIYVPLARIVAVYTTSVSRIKQRNYSIIFVACDIVSLLLQAAGGAITTSDEASTIQAGIKIMLAGLAAQVASLTLYLGICLDLAWRIYRLSFRTKGTASPGTDSVENNGFALHPDFAGLRASRSWGSFLVLQGLATICIYVRSVFRVAELSGGFDSHLANDEVTFMGLEGAMISLAAIALSTWGHPGIGFQGRWSELDYAMFSRTRK